MRYKQNKHTSKQISTYMRLKFLRWVACCWPVYVNVPYVRKQHKNLCRFSNLNAVFISLYRNKLYNMRPLLTVQVQSQRHNSQVRMFVFAAKQQQPTCAQLSSDYASEKQRMILSIIIIVRPPLILTASATGDHIPRISGIIRTSS